MMKTVKRKANVGERILVTNVTGRGTAYAKDDILTVCEVNIAGVYVSEHRVGLYHHEYEVIVEEPKKSARITALETEVSALKAKVEALEQANKQTVHNVTINVDSVKSIGDITKFFDTLSHKFPLTARFNREFDAETNAKADGILADIKRKARTPNEQRADVIKRAKAFVDGLLSDKPVKRRIVFNVNAEKRTVVALFYSFETHPATVEAKGIAKCDPDDVFNADIGKAIALARALGVNCPQEFVKAVQPTEVVVGQTIQSNVFRENFYEVTRTSDDRAYISDSESYFLFNDYPRAYRIANDTDAVYE